MMLRMNRTQRSLVQFLPTTLLSIGAVACGNSPAAKPDGVVTSPTVDGAIEPTRLVTANLVQPPADLAAAGLVFAYQDGDGPWQLAPAAVNGKISLALTSEKFGFASGCARPSSSTVTLDLIYATITESPQFDVSVRRCRAQVAPPVLSSITGNISSGTQQTHNLVHGFRQVSIDTMDATSGSYTLPAAVGTADLILSRQNTDDSIINKFSIQRDVAVTNTPVTKDLDFNQMPAPEVIVQPIGPGGGYLGVVYFTATSILFSDALFGPFNITVPAASQRIATDKIDIYGGQSGPGDLDSIDLDQVVSTPSALVFPATNMMGPVTATAVAGTKSLQVSWPLSVSGASYRSELRGGAVTCNNCFLIIDARFSPAWMGNAPSWTTPDFSGITTGWNPVFDIAPDTVQIFGDIEQGSYPDVGYKLISYSKGASIAPVPPSPLARNLDRAARQICNPAWDKIGRDTCIIASKTASN
jgi:hypothetical protein